MGSVKFTGKLALDGRPASFTVPDADVETFIPAIINNAAIPLAAIPAGLSPLDVILDDGRRVRFFGAPQMIPAMIASFTQPGGIGGPSGGAAVKDVAVRPCKGCGKSLGVGSLAEALLSGEAPLAFQEARVQVCEHRCTAVDSQGNKIYRVIDGVGFCGVPRPGARSLIPTLEEMKMMYRDETKDGCGCPVKEKAKYKASRCPLGLYGPLA